METTCKTSGVRSPSMSRLLSLFTFLGHIHPVIWAFLIFLLFLFGWSLVRMLRSHNRLRGSLASFATSLRQITVAEPKQMMRGLTLEKLDVIRVSLEGLESLPTAWWIRVSRSISQYVSPNEEEGWFITQPASELLPYDTVVRQNFHTAEFSATPGILTGLGLTGTFIAILIALYGVRYDIHNSASSAEVVGRFWFRESS